MDNKIVLITGASSGIGEACALTFAKAKARVILCARRVEKLNALSEQIKSEYGAETLILTMDVSDREAVQQTLSSLPADWADIDILVNNAGLASGVEKMAEADLDDWEKMIDVNVKGLLYVTRQLLPAMTESSKTKHIINIGSIAGQEAYIGGGVYCATKFAVRALNEALRKETCGTKVRVSSVNPGMVETSFSNVRFKGDNAKADSVYAGMVPLTATDVADMVFYCAAAPDHVNIAEVLILPSCQASVAIVDRGKD